MNCLGVVGICYYCGYEGYPYPRWARKQKGNPTWEMYKLGKQERKENKPCRLDEVWREKYKRELCFSTKTSYAGKQLPQSAKKIKEVKNEEFDVFIGFWETKINWYYLFKVADISWICCTAKKDRIVKSPTPIEEDYLEQIENYVKMKTAINQPQYLKFLKWLSQFRYV